MQNKKIVSFLPALLFTSLLFSQPLSGISTQWSDSFVAWDIFIWDKNEEEKEVITGTLTQRWINVKEDWTEWDFNFDEQEGTIKLKWKNDPSQWELRSFRGDIVTMKMIWTGDITEWRISDGMITLDWHSRYTNTLGLWELRTKEYGKFSVQVMNDNDPRDWDITDELDDNISVSMKLAMTFIAVWQSSPKQ